jgi:hypothetical protein
MSEVDARELDLARTAEAFCEASIRDWTGRAARMLAGTPHLAGYDFATAVVLGDATRVRHEIEHDPAIATRPGARTGCCSSCAATGSAPPRSDAVAGRGARHTTRVRAPATLLVPGPVVRRSQPRRLRRGVRRC